MSLFWVDASLAGLVLLSLLGSDVGSISSLFLSYSHQSVDQYSNFNTVLVDLVVFESDANDPVWSGSTR